MPNQTKIREIKIFFILPFFFFYPLSPFFILSLFRPLNQMDPAIERNLVFSHFPLFLAEDGFLVSEHRYTLNFNFGNNASR